MVKAEVVRRRLKKLDEYLSYLEKVQQTDRQEFLNNIETWASSERFLHMAIESINDIASHIIAEEDYGIVEEYRDIPNLFFEQGLIDDELKESWIKMTGFRNILVHDYTDIDRSEVYKILKNHLTDIQQVRKTLAQFL